MADKQIRVVVSANGAYRRLLVMSDRPDGSVYVRVYSGLNAGLTDLDSTIREHRFSLHPSPDLDYSVMHRHMLLKTGEEGKSASRVSAIKAGQGFSPVFFSRFTDLLHPLHDISASKGAKACKIFHDEFNFDYKKCTLFMGLFVGAPGATFEPLRSDTIYKEWVFEELKVLILAGYSDFPASPFGLAGQLLGAITDAVGTLAIMRPLSSGECEELFRISMNQMWRSQIKELLGQDMPDESRKALEWLLNEFVTPLPSGVFNLINKEQAPPQKQIPER